MKAQSPEISVIMPVYNQEKFLEKALESVGAQTFKDFELIIVNDGSTDRSESIIKDYCERHPNYRYVTKPNGGVGAARETGIGLARGNYIIHLDPDDWVEPDYLERLHTRAVEEDADVVMCNYIEEHKGKALFVNISDFGATSQKELKKRIADETIWACLWNKLIKAPIVKDHDIHFEPGINFHEDRLYFYRLLNHIHKISYLPDYLYHYNRLNEHSALNNQSKSTLIQMWTVRLLMVDCEKDPEMLEILSRILVTDKEIYNLLAYPGVTEEEFRHYIYPFRKEAERIARQKVKRYFLNYHRHLRFRRIALIASSMP